MENMMQKAWDFIHYRFLGVVEIPTDENYEPLKVSTRQGVTVEYVPNVESA